MTRPAVIIGLGGTGQEVLTYIKKDLLEVNDGKMPDNVRLLAFDTMPAAQASTTVAGQVSGDSASGTNKSQKAIGQVMLEKNREFFGLSGDGKQMGDMVAQGKAPHIGSWFDANFYREKLAPSLWDLSAGAGAIRQFGRLSFFMHFSDTVYTEISKAYTEVKQSADIGNELEVLIIASFAGGTGAGMFIDTGIVCRMLASTVNNNLKIRGLFVLPRVFAQQGDLSNMALFKRARAFAAWRELERVMNVGSEYGAPRVQYQVNGKVYQLDARPFDQCYLVDSKRQSNNLERLNPQEGVFPGIADFISFLIDRESGQQYTLDATNRDSHGYASGKGVGYAALGTWAVKAPVHYALEEYSLNFSKDLMDVWLVPQRDMDQKVTGLASNQNREAGFKDGEEAAPVFLANSNGVQIQVKDQGTPTGRPDNIIHNTRFLEQMGSLLQLTQADRAKRRTSDAQGGHTRLINGTVQPSSYLEVFTALPVDYKDTSIYYDQEMQPIDESYVQNEVRASVINDVPSSKALGEKPSLAPSRILPAVDKYQKKHFSAGGQGAFGEMLQRVRLFQEQRFREQIHQWTLNVLNGTSADPRENLTGKLGYARAFFSKLVMMLDEYDSYIREVKETRAALNPPLPKQALDSLSQTQKEMDRHKDEKCVFFLSRPHPRAHLTQRSYLWAVEDYHTVLKDDMLLETIDQTTCRLREIAQQALQAVEKWARALVLGTDSGEGVYRALENDLKGVASVQAADRALTRSQYLINMKGYSGIDQLTKDQRINEQLGRIHWKVSSEGGLGITCTVKVPVKVKDANGDVRWVDQERQLVLDDSETAKKSNLEIIKQLGLFAFREEGEKHQAIDEVMHMRSPNYSDITVFGPDLTGKSSPLMDLKMGINDADLIKSWYLRINDTYRGVSPTVTEYANHLKDWINDRRHDFSFQSTRSEDQHQLTFVQVVDVVQSSDFNLWEELRNSYREHITSGAYAQENASRLHIFPAERNAAEYETKLFTMLENKGHRVFHPRVVMLMEDKRRIQLFFRCWAFNLIKRLQDSKSGMNYYTLEVPRRTGYIEQKMTLTNLFDQQNRPRSESPDIFELINAFVNKACDIHTRQNQIVWDDLENTALIMENEERSKGLLKTRFQKMITEGLVAQLREIAEESRKDFRKNHPEKANSLQLMDWGPGQEYEDLADLAEMIYREVMAENKPSFDYIDPFAPSGDGQPAVEPSDAKDEEPKDMGFRF